MSENNNNGKKNFFKRLSGFKKFLVIYASALVVIIAVALVLLYRVIKGLRGWQASQYYG